MGAQQSCSQCINRTNLMNRVEVYRENKEKETEKDLIESVDENLSIAAKAADQGQCSIVLRSSWYPETCELWRRACLKLQWKGTMPHGFDITYTQVGETCKVNLDWSK